MGKGYNFLAIFGMGLAISFLNTVSASAKDELLARAKKQKGFDLAQASIGDRAKKNPLTRQSVSNWERLNTDADSLYFPTQPSEVEANQMQPLTLEEAIELSLKNNKDIIEARQEIERSQFALREEQALLYPTLDLTRAFISPSVLGYRNSGFLDSIAEQQADSGMSSAGAASSSVKSFVFSPDLTLGYTIYDGGFRGASIRIAQKQLRIAELELETVVEQTRLEVATDYYVLQNGDASVEIAEAAVEDAVRTLRDAELIERSGVGTRFDVLRARVELSEANQTLTLAIAQREIARKQLAETLGISQNTNLIATDAIAEAGIWELSLPESIVQAFKNRAELEQILLQREVNQEQQTIARSQTRPTIAAAANYSLNDDFEDDFDIVDQYSVGLNLQWRLYDGGAASAGVRQAEKEAEINETQFARTRNQIRLAVESAYLQLISNQRNIGAAGEEIELAEESLRMARLKFQEGIGTQTDVIDAQTQLTVTRDRFLSAIINYNQSYADLIRQVSNLPDNGLQDLP